MSERIFRIHPFPQQESYGCLYHSVAAITGEEAWLEHIEDVSSFRWRLRLIEAGYWLDPVYWNQYEQATPAFWREFFEENSDYGFRMVLTVPSAPPLSHKVGALISPMDGVCYVYDSAEDEMHEFTPGEFAESRFARCNKAEVLMDTSLEDHPEEEPYGEAYERALQRHQEQSA